MINNAANLHQENMRMGHMSVFLQLHLYVLMGAGTHHDGGQKG